MKKVFSLILALGLIASLTACGGGNASGNETGDSAPAASTAKLRFVTGGESGTYYAFGSVIAQHATNNTDVSVTGLVGNGSKSNVEELADGNAELAFCQSDVMAYAYNGTNLFENPIDCFSTVAALYMEDVQIVTTDPSIKTVADLAGKNVSVGAAGSGVYFNAVDILSAYGLGDLDADGKFTKINATYQSFGDSADSLKDGKIDAAFIVAGAPTTAITELQTAMDIYLLGLDDAVMDEFIANNKVGDYAVYAKMAVTHDQYACIPADAPITTIGVTATYIVSNSLSEDQVYNMTKALWESKDEIAKAHAVGSGMDINNAFVTIGNVPLHPGAAKYYTEMGLNVG